MLAPDGRCKTLDAAGDGYVRAEDCIALLLRALVDDQDSSAAMCCILQGSAVRQVGPPARPACRCLLRCCQRMTPADP